MTARRQSKKRIDELLSDRALAGLTPEEGAELAALLEGTDDESFDRAAAALDLATTSDGTPLPAHLAAKIEVDALRALSAAETVPLRPPARRREPLPYAGWLVAAACFALALAGWLRTPPGQSLVETPAPPATAARVEPVASPPASAWSPSAMREKLLSMPDVVHVDWSPTKDPGGRGASGDVVWSNGQQAGCMRFHGLAANDPARSQYQLWIFDPSQSAKTPIDGGVFDVEPTTGDVIVPITPKLHVSGPTLFAITVEKPGGVVVSKREHIVVVAAVKT
jgi:hypothetical protein